jgi:hypothetical protein
LGEKLKAEKDAEDAEKEDPELLKILSADGENANDDVIEAKLALANANLEVGEISGQIFRGFFFIEMSADFLTGCLLLGFVAVVCAGAS